MQKKLQKIGLKGEKFDEKGFEATWKSGRCGTTDNVIPLTLSRKENNTACQQSQLGSYSFRNLL